MLNDFDFSIHSSINPKSTANLPRRHRMAFHMQLMKIYITIETLLILARPALAAAGSSSESVPISPMTSVDIQYDGRDGLGFLTSKDDDGFDQYVDRQLGLQLDSEFPGIQAALAKSVLS